MHALVIVVFISRWMLAALEKSEFGLYGVVGGMLMIALAVSVMRHVRGVMPQR